MGRPQGKAGWWVSWFWRVSRPGGRGEEEVIFLDGGGEGWFLVMRVDVRRGFGCLGGRLRTRA